MKMNRKTACFVMMVLTASLLMCAGACKKEPKVGATGDSEAVLLVKKSMTAMVGQEPDALNFQEAPLQDGVAVVAADTAAYWVKDGEVYSLGMPAIMWSPRARKDAPVTQQDVQAVAGPAPESEIPNAE